MEIRTRKRTNDCGIEPLAGNDIRAGILSFKIILLGWSMPTPMMFKNIQQHHHSAKQNVFSDSTHPDSKVPGPNIGPIWAPCWPHEPCYQGNCSISIKHSFLLLYCCGCTTYSYPSQWLHWHWGSYITVPITLEDITWPINNKPQ